MSEIDPADKRLAPNTEASRGMTFIRSTRSLIFEVFVIFFGISAAFWVENLREAAEINSRAERILETIQIELSQDHDWYMGWIDSINTQRSAWQTRRSRGEQVPPFVVRIPGSEIASKAAWEAALASDVLRVLDPNLVRALGNHYSERAGIGLRFARYMAQTESLVYPLLNADVASFYDPATQEFYPRFEGNMTLMNEVMWEFDHKVNCWSLLVSDLVRIELDRLRQGHAPRLLLRDDPSEQCPYTGNYIDERLRNLYSLPPPV